MGGQIGVLWGYGGCGEWGMLDTISLYVYIYLWIDEEL